MDQSFLKQKTVFPVSASLAGRYFKLFTLSNLIFLVILLAEWRIIGR